MRDGPGWGTTPIGEVEYTVTMTMQVRAQSAEAACNQARGLIGRTGSVLESLGYKFTVQKAERA